MGQDFNPDDFTNMSEEGMDKSQLAGLMTSSSHVPYILSRLNMSLKNTEDEGQLNNSRNIIFVTQLFNYWMTRLLVMSHSNVTMSHSNVTGIFKLGHFPTLMHLYVG